MNLLDFFSREAGQQRRKWLDETVGGAIEYITPPNLRPAVNLAAQMNPIQGMGDAMQAGEVLFSPEATADARKRAALDMGIEIAMAATPAALAKMGYMAAPQALAETFAMSGDALAEKGRGLLSDAQYAGRSIAQGDPKGVLEAFQRGGTPQSVGAAADTDLLGYPMASIQKPAKLYSPSLRAAENLSQKKGPYEQLRAMMLKNGAKTDELEWTGADEVFKGKKVTQDEIIDYLRENTDAISVQSNYSGDGRLGASLLDDDPEAAFNSWFKYYVEEDLPWADQIADDYIENLADDLRYNGDERLTYLPSISEDEFKNLLKKGYTEEDLNSNDWLFDDGKTQKFFYSGSDFVEDQLGGREALKADALRAFKEPLYDDFSSDPEDFANRYDMSDIRNGIDVGNTRFSGYFPDGGENYQENLLKYDDPRENILQDDVASSRHWREKDAGTIYHTRQADYDVVDGGRARYIGEIQSDPQQNLKGKTPAPYEYLSNKGIYKQNVADLEEALRNKDFEASQNFTRLRDEFNFWGQKNPDLLNQLKHDFLVKEYNFAQELNSGLFFNLPDDTNSQVGKLPINAKEWTDEQNEKFLDWYRDHIQYYDLGDALPRHAMRNPKLLGDKVEADIVRGIGGEQVDIESARDETYNILNSQKQNAYEAKSYAAGGPLMSSQNKWLDNALRRSIVDAVNDNNVDYLTFPFNREAIGVVGGSMHTPKQGAVDFYQRDTQNRLKKILKGIDPSIQIEDVNLKGTSISDLGDFNSRGFRLTPEFRSKVRQSGLPAWMIAGGVGLGGIMEYLKEKREEPKYGPRRSLLEM